MHNNIDYSTVKAISNSSLNLLESSPRKFLKFYNQEFEEKDETYFKQGSAIHCYILEPDEFKKRYKFLDFSLPNSPNKKQFVEFYLNSKGTEDERITEAYKKSYVTTTSDEVALKKGTELKEELKGYFKSLKYQNSDITVFPMYFKALLEKIKSELLYNPKAKELLFTEVNEIKDIDIFNELPIYWTMKKEDSEYNFKALLDRVIIDKDNKKILLIDLKTTKDIDKFGTESFFNYHYDRQLAFYSLAVLKFFEQQYPQEDIEKYSIEHYIAAVNKENKPEARVFLVSEKTILNASQQIVKLLDRIHWHFTNNKWEYSVEQYTDGYEII